MRRCQEGRRGLTHTYTKFHPGDVWNRESAVIWRTSPNRFYTWSLCLDLHQTAFNQSNVDLVCQDGRRGLFARQLEGEASCVTLRRQRAHCALIGQRLNVSASDVTLPLCIWIQKGRVHITKLPYVRSGARACWWLCVWTCVCEHVTMQPLAEGLFDSSEFSPD